MKLIDMHCDTLWKMMDLDKEGNLMENQCSINIPGMKKAGTLAQFFACFTYLEDYKAKGAYEKGYARILEMIRFLDQQINAFPDEIARACSRKEILRNESEGKISALLGGRRRAQWEDGKAGGIVSERRPAGNAAVESRELYRASKQQAAGRDVAGIEAVWNPDGRENERAENDRRCVPRL